MIFLNGEIMFLPEVKLQVRQLPVTSNSADLGESPVAPLEEVWSIDLLTDDSDGEAD